MHNGDPAIYQLQRQAFVWALRHGAPAWDLARLPLDKMAVILAYDIFRHIFMNEKFFILIKNSLKFVAKVSIDNSPALV